ncbi:hypothetical protein [Leptolyngbya sp. FACHB-17]|uniref:hypothetical protein n=1 Tax=unclassified Leptolyngbya TaxID=2650499 RepID=UPI0016816253|nr:hypothetical protein [Leptolyngbya sp. FACHB-17]MBD2081431.1 hypothetical protein [Leptolyngbya sp. FACHB-17]
MSLTEFDSTLQRLGQVRFALLRLHKALLDGERVRYEQEYGRIRSNTEFFQLVLENEWFAWLRPISQFIVQIDEALSAKEPITLAQADELLVQTRQLMQPSQTGSTLEQNYYHAIQRDPDIAFIHAELANMLTVK